MSGQAKKTQRKALGRGLRALISTPDVTVSPEENRASERVPGASEDRVVPLPEQAKGTAVVPTPNENASKTTGVEKLPEVGDSVFFLDIDSITGNVDQPRKEFKEGELKELADSITALGVIQPILVRSVSDFQYEIVAGERRWRAAKIAGLSQVPVIVRDLGDKETLEIALVENVQRSNLSVTEEARAYQNLMDEFNLTQREVAERVGKDRATVANFLRLLKLPPEVLAMMNSGEITMGHAKAILTAREPSVQKNLAKKCVQEGLSVRALEQIVARSIVLEKPRKKPIKGSNSAFPEVADRLRKSLGTKVAIKHDSKSGRGKVVVEYFSEEELDRLVDILGQ